MKGELVVNRSHKLILRSTFGLNKFRIHSFHYSCTVPQVTHLILTNKKRTAKNISVTFSRLKTNYYMYFITAPFNNMQTLKFKASQRNGIFYFFFFLGGGEGLGKY